MKLCHQIYGLPNLTTMLPIPVQKHRWKYWRDCIWMANSSYETCHKVRFQALTTSGIEDFNNRAGFNYLKVTWLAIWAHAISHFEILYVLIERAHQGNLPQGISNGHCGMIDTKGFGPQDLYCPQQLHDQPAHPTFLYIVAVHNFQIAMTCIANHQNTDSHH